jgi:hypothetical protein
MSYYDPNHGAPGAPYPSYPPPSPYPPPPMAQKPNRGCLWWLGLGAAGFLGLIVIGAIVGIAAGTDDTGDDDRSTGTTAAAAGATTVPAEEGIETDSNNTDNPPPADINDDLSCATEQFMGPVARGTLTNHSSQLSGYMITVGFLDGAGTRVADGTAFVNSVQAGQTATWEAPALNPNVQFETCEVVSVERMAQ